MARRKKGRAIHGWLVLDKPADMTSTQAVGTVRRLYDARKAGHAGTLDPLATGVLPIALGEATKTVPYAVEGTKHYRFTVRWGAATDTDDAEGETVATSELRPAREAIEALLLMLAPLAPHIAEELWERSGRPYSIHRQSWPAWDEALARENEVTLVVQVNGKVRDRIQVPADIDEASAKELAKASTVVQKHLRDGELQRVVYVPGKLVNFVVGA